MWVLLDIKTKEVLGYCIAIALSAPIIVLITVRTCLICYFPTHLTPFLTLFRNRSRSLSGERLSLVPNHKQAVTSVISVFLSSEPLGPLTWRLLFSHSVVSYSLRPHGLQHARLPYHQLLELAQTHIHQVGGAIQPSHSLIPFSSCLQSFPASDMVVPIYLVACLGSLSSPRV